MSQNGALWAPGRLLGDDPAPRACPEPSWSRPGGPPGPQKNYVTAPGGAPVEIWSPLTSIRGRPGVDFGLRLGGPGAPRSVLLELSFEICDFSIFCTPSTRKPCFLRFGESKIEPKMASNLIQNPFSQQVGPKTALKSSKNRSKIALGSLRAQKML